jgi:hypothetical protein
MFWRYSLKTRTQHTFTSVECTEDGVAKCFSTNKASSGIMMSRVPPHTYTTKLTEVGLLPMNKNGEIKPLPHQIILSLHPSLAHFF